MPLHPLFQSILQSHGAPKPVDPKSYELAEHFLNNDATPAMKHELAEWIQHHVELWLYDDKEGAREAAETLGARHGPEERPDWSQIQRS